VWTLLLAVYLALAGVAITLRLLNLRHLKRHGHEVPPELRDVIDAQRLENISDYTRLRGWLGLLGLLSSRLALAAFLFGGGLALYDRAIRGAASALWAQALLFFLGLSLAGTLLSLPFSLYETFRVEARFGFNRMSLGLWFADLLKGLVLSWLFVAIVTLGGLALVSAFPNFWWLWVWGFVSAFGVVLTYLSPYLIEPLFFKMQPLNVPELGREVKAMAERAGVHVDRVMQIDASRRSRHSNAYFTGLGHTKRVVLFDTLLEQMNHREILAVLAHELGHWRRHHGLKRLLVLEALALLGCYAIQRLTSLPALPPIFGLEQASFPACVLLAGFICSLGLTLATPLFSWWSRRHEWEADRFASELTQEPAQLASALAKLARENLANLHPHPLFAAFYYSHPPMADRMRKLIASR
jgi:STE24 endopeptidase